MWFIPEPGSDIVEMFQQPNKWNSSREKIRRFGIPALSLEPNFDHKLILDNTYENFVRADAFQKLSDWNIDLDVAVGSVKPDIHCDAKTYARDHSKLFERVKQQGGKIHSFTMDWPRASGKLDCRQSVDQTAEYVADYVRTVRAAYDDAHPGEKLEIGLWEGYPTFEPRELIQWLDTMTRHGYTPDYLTVDIDRDHHKRLKRSDAQMRTVLRTIKAACEERGIRFGVAMWSNKMKTTRTYQADIVAWTKLVNSAVGTPDIVQMISWEYWVQYQNEGRVRPYNLPEEDVYSHTGLLLSTARTFGL